jgi:hypothetical protein
VSTESHLARMHLYIRSCDGTTLEEGETLFASGLTEADMVDLHESLHESDETDHAQDQR